MTLGERPAEVQNVAIRVLDLEPTQSVVIVFEGQKELDVARGEFCGESVRIGNVYVGIPTRDTLLDVPSVIWQRLYANIFEHQHRPAALDNAEEDVVGFGALRTLFQTRVVAIELKRRRNVSNDKER